MEKTFILIVFFLIFFMLIINFPVFIIMLIAKANKVDISFKETWKLYKLKSADKAFFNSAAKYQENKISVSLDKLAAHRLSGGNLDNCLDGLLYSKENNLNADFMMVSAIDLAGKNVRESFSDANKIYEIRINNIENQLMSLSYKVSYKYLFPSVFVDKDSEKTKEKIGKKLKVFLDTWTEQDVFKTEQMIRSNILNTDFWEESLRIILIKQDFNIKNKNSRL